MDLNQTTKSKMRCFLCRKKCQSVASSKEIDSTICPASKKSMRSILNHLAQFAGIELHIPMKEYVCNNCYCQISEYDVYLVRTVRKKESLTRLIEKSLVAIDSDVEDFEDELANMGNFEDVLHFVDGMDVSDTEIDEAIREAVGGRKRKRNEEARKQSNEQMLYDCGMCSMRFRSKTAYLKHMNQAHRKFTCEICNYSHRNEDYVLLHQNLHEGKSENQCRYCDKEFTTKISTIRHMEAHLNMKKYQCDKCGLCFSQTTVLYNHKLQHEAEEKPLRCEVCNQIFKTKRTYRHHLITHQADRPRYACEVCNRTFTEKYTLKVHKRTHHDDELIQQMETIKKERQTRHDDIEVVGVMPEDVSATETIISDGQHLQAYEDATAVDGIDVSVTPTGGADKNKISCCIICDQPFANRDQMNKHMERDHDVILKSLSFNNAAQYEVVSSDEAIKPCHICGQTFHAQSDLDYHLEHMHGLSFK